MKTKLLFVLLVVIGLQPAFGQYNRCGTTDYQASLEAADPTLHARRVAGETAIAQIIQNNPQYRTGSIITIPVVFHVLYFNAGENISDNRIFDQVQVLNDDYARLNSNATNTRSQFLQVAANTQIQFCLAQRTPAGLSTNGIVRLPSTTQYLPTNPNSISPEWDHTKYLNFYVGNLSSGLLGYSTFPPGSPGNDHVVLLYASVGGYTFPGTAAPYDHGRTATHEVGHWLNLYHTFEAGCAGSNANNCATSGDHVCDTPPVSASNFGCPSNNPNSCTETSPFPPPYTSDMVDMYENYMDYTDDDCMNVFTQGQSARMNAALTTLRTGILTSDGCVPVGVNEILDQSLVIVSPNPSHGMFEVSLGFPNKNAVKITVTDVAGKEVYAVKIEDASATKININLAKASAGIYQMKIETDNGYLIKKLVITQ